MLMLGECIMLNNVTVNGNVNGDLKSKPLASKSKPIIVLATFTLQGGGAERFVLTLAKAFFKLGFDVRVIAFKAQVDYELTNDVTVHFLNYQQYRWLPKSLRYPLFAKIFDGFVKKHIGTPTLILSNLYQVDCVLHHSKLDNIVYVIHNTLSMEYKLMTCHFDGHQKKINDLKQLYANHPVVCVSHGVKDDFVQYLGQHPKMTAIHNPIAQDDIKRQANAFDAHAKLPKSCEQGYLIHVGKFKPQKDHKSLIQAYAQSTQALPLVLLGMGGEMSACEQLADELGVLDRVIFMGFQSNPYPFIKSATAMILASQFEGFGIVIAESLSLGVPVISTDCPHGPAELLPDNCLVELNNLSALTDKINQVMNKPQDFITPFATHLLPECVAQAYLDFMRVSRVD